MDHEIVAIFIHHQPGKAIALRMNQAIRIGAAAQQGFLHPAALFETLENKRTINVYFAEFKDTHRDIGLRVDITGSNHLIVQPHMTELAVLVKLAYGAR